MTGFVNWTYLFIKKRCSHLLSVSFHDTITFFLFYAEWLWMLCVNSYCHGLSCKTGCLNIEHTEVVFFFSAFLSENTAFFAYEKCKWGSISSISMCVAVRASRIACAVTCLAHQEIETMRRVIYQLWHISMAVWEKEGYWVLREW